MPKPYEIVVPLFNDEANFVKLLESLVDVGVLPTDVIVSMSGLLGRISEIVKKYQFRLLYSDWQLTPSVARNLGAKETSADYLVFLDSDILVTNEWKSALDEIVSQKIVDLTGETYDVSKSPNWIEKNWFSEIRKRKRSYLNGGNIVVKSEVFLALNGFSEELSTGEDYDFSMRAREQNFGPSFDARLVVHHEGNPKSISGFVKREKWHAQGDLVSLQHFFRSRVMLASTFYFLLLVVTLFFLVSGNILMFAFLLLVLFFCCMAITMYKLGWQGLGTVKASILMNFYLLGRGWALMERLSKAFHKLLYR